MSDSAFSAWIGRSEEVHDQLSRNLVKRIAATFGEVTPAHGEALPPLWHWIHFLPLHRWSELAEDGHGKRGGFVPPVPLPRRMFAGARIRFLQPLLVGEPARRVGTIRDLVLKTGRTGRLAFLRVDQEVIGPRGTALIEEQDIVYREAPRPGPPETPPPPAPRHADWTRRVTPDIALLFRYSAITWNGHRIHYDADYARDVEGYPAVVQNGGLTMHLLLESALRRAPGRLVGYSARLRRPLFMGQAARFCGRTT
ncbi:MAG: MaoC family dehydratase N-terminal domain-containing protein, partial [Pseudomonas sp.]|nr:MaoC family dehydratase N-terminal domain-containing protein [Pseudomonas sp.]